MGEETVFAVMAVWILPFLVVEPEDVARTDIGVQYSLFRLQAIVNVLSLFRTFYLVFNRLTNISQALCAFTCKNVFQ